jgi:hypothetical protein
MCGNGPQSKDDQFKAIIVTNESDGSDITLKYFLRNYYSRTGGPRRDNTSLSSTPC